MSKKADALRHSFTFINPKLMLMSQVLDLLDTRESTMKKVLKAVNALGYKLDVALPV